jgi:hypothetical protein
MLLAWSTSHHGLLGIHLGPVGGQAAVRQLDVTARAQTTGAYGRDRPRDRVVDCFTTSVMSTPLSALLTGRVALASSAADRKPPAPSPSTSPETVSVIPKLQVGERNLPAI